MSTFVSAQAVMQAAVSATRSMFVCVPSQDYYRRSGDWTEEQIVYIDAGAFIQALEEMIREEST